MNKKVGQTDLKKADKIIEGIWGRICDKYEAFLEIDEEFRLEDSMSSDLEEVLSIFMRIHSNKKLPTAYSMRQIDDILESIVAYNKKHKEVILITDEERLELNSLVDFNFAQ